MFKPKESDWKTFAKNLPAWRDRYFDRQTQKLAKRLVDPAKNPTDRFWETLEFYEKQAKKVDRNMGKYSRSNMFFDLLGMLNLGMLKESELDVFSDELREKILFIRHQR